MHRLLIRIYLESNDGDLDATVEREIEVPFVPRRGMRLDFGDKDDEPMDVVLGRPVWRVAKGRFEYEMTEQGENDGAVVCMLDEWTDVGFRVAFCSNERLWDDYRNGPANGNGHSG